MKNFVSFMEAILIIVKDFKGVYLFWFFIYFMGNWAFYIVEKVLGYETITRWYDVVWLAFCYFMTVVNLYILYIWTIKRLKAKQ